MQATSNVFLLSCIGSLLLFMSWAVLLPQHRLVWRPVAPSMALGCTASSQRSSPAIVGMVAECTAPSLLSSPVILEQGVVGSCFGHVTATTEHSTMLEVNCGSGRHRRRCPRFRSRANAGRSEPFAPPETPLLVNNGAREVHAAHVPVELANPPCIINWSNRIARAEEDLAHPVTVSVISIMPLAPVHAIAKVLAANLDTDASSLVLRHDLSSSYLLMLPDMSLVNRLIDLPQPLHSPRFSLLCKKWRRFAGATGKTLPCQVDIELSGIPAHVWETSTVEQLLNPHVWIDHVHGTTSELNDLSSFRCSVWCLDSNKIPLSKDLWVAEPPNSIVEDPHVKRFMAYPIRFKTLIGPSSSDLAPRPPPSPPEDDSDEGPSARQWCKFAAVAAVPLFGSQTVDDSIEVGGMGASNS